MERVAVNLLYDAAKAGVKARRQTSRAAAKTLRLCVAVGQGCDGGLARAVKRALRPKTASLRLYVAGVGQGHEPAVVHAMADAVIVLAGQDAAVAADLYRAYASRRVPCLVLVNFDDAAAERARALVAREVSAEDIVVCDEMAVGGMLARWLIETLPDFETMLGAALDCCQDEQGRRIVGQAVRDNAMLGALTFLRGADTPAMLACEVAMLFKLAGNYGAPMGKERLVDVAGLTAFSLVCKQVAGLALRTPLPACLVKAGVAAAGTWVAGTVMQGRMRQAGQVEAAGEAVADRGYQGAGADL